MCLVVDTHGEHVYKRPGRYKGRVYFNTWFRDLSQECNGPDRNGKDTKEKVQKDKQVMDLKVRRRRDLSKSDARSTFLMGWR